MRNYFLYIIVAISFYTISCNCRAGNRNINKQPLSTTSYVTIQGHLSPYEPVIIYFTDKYDEFETYLGVSDSNGIFLKKIFLYEPTLATVVRNHKHSYVWLIANDTLSLYIPSNNLFQYRISSKSAIYNNVLAYLYDFSGHYNLSDVEIAYTPGMNLHYFDSLCMAYKNRKLKIFKNVLSKKELTPDFIKNFYLTINNSYIVELVLPYLVPSSHYESLPKWYINKLLQYKGTFNDSAISCFEYRMAAFDYNKFLSEYYFKDLSINHQFETAQKNFTGRTRDFILYKIMKNNMRKFLPSYSIFLRMFNSKCLSNDYKYHLDSLYNIFSIASTPDSVNKATFLTRGSKKVTLYNIISNNKGKVILIDFWATWCAPCKYQFPYLKKIRDSYSKNDLTVIDISFDLRTEIWRKFLDNDASLAGIQYYSVDGFKNSLAKIIGLKSIPRFMLINKKGDIVNTDAPRPSDPQLFRMINRLVSQHFF
ncbi:MAG: TlpA family protein disulfide reductase [Chitinophagaceae bacterium]|nr:MAG: TlpA family protein disulfide reductase [Chitinophagaceae bacterium]